MYTSTCKHWVFKDNSLQSSIMYFDFLFIAQMDTMLANRDIKSTMNHSVLAESLQLLPILTRLEDYLNLHAPIAQFSKLLTEDEKLNHDEGMSLGRLKKLH